MLQAVLNNNILSTPDQTSLFVIVYYVTIFLDSCVLFYYLSSGVTFEAVSGKPEVGTFMSKLVFSAGTIGVLLILKLLGVIDFSGENNKAHALIGLGLFLLVIAILLTIKQMVTNFIEISAIILLTIFIYFAFDFYSYGTDYIDINKVDEYGFRDKLDKAYIIKQPFKMLLLFASNVIILLYFLFRLFSSYTKKPKE